MVHYKYQNYINIITTLTYIFFKTDTITGTIINI